MKASEIYSMSLSFNKSVNPSQNPIPSPHDTAGQVQSGCQRVGYNGMDTGELALSFTNQCTQKRWPYPSLAAAVHLSPPEQALTLTGYHKIVLVVSWVQESWQKYTFRISIIWGNGRIAERSLNKGPVLV